MGLILAGKGLMAGVFLFGLGAGCGVMATLWMVLEGPLPGDLWLLLEAGKGQKYKQGSLML